MKKALPYLFVILCVLLDISVLPAITRSYMLPLMTLCSVIALGLLLGRTRGTLLGLIGGVLIDVLVGYPLGLMMIAYLICGYASGFSGRKFQRYIITPVVAPLLCLLFFEAVMLGYLYLAAVEIQTTLLIHAGIRMAIELGLIQVLYLLYNRILKPRWSRYAAG